MLVCSATAAITELITFPTQTCRLRFVDVPPSCRGRAACVSWTCCVTVGDVLLACRGRAACVSGTCCVRVGDVLLACRGRAACLSGTCCLLVGDVLLACRGRAACLSETCCEQLAGTARARRAFPSYASRARIRAASAGSRRRTGCLCLYWEGYISDTTRAACHRLTAWSTSHGTPSPTPLSLPLPPPPTAPATLR